MIAHEHEKLYTVREVSHSNKFMPHMTRPQHSKCCERITATVAYYMAENKVSIGIKTAAFNNVEYDKAPAMTSQQETLW